MGYGSGSTHRTAVSAVCNLINFKWKIVKTNFVIKTLKKWRPLFLCNTLRTFPIQSNNISPQKIAFHCRYYINLSEKTTSWEDPRKFKSVHIPLQVIVKSSRKFQCSFYFHLQRFSTSTCKLCQYVIHVSPHFSFSFLFKIQTPIPHLDIAWITKENSDLSNAKLSRPSVSKFRPQCECECKSSAIEQDIASQL